MAAGRAVAAEHRNHHTIAVPNRSNLAAGHQAQVERPSEAVAVRVRRVMLPAEREQLLGVRRQVERLRAVAEVLERANPTGLHPSKIAWTLVGSWKKPLPSPVAVGQKTSSQAPSIRPYDPKQLVVRNPTVAWKAGCVPSLDDHPGHLDPAMFQELPDRILCPYHLALVLQTWEGLHRVRP